MNDVVEKDPFEKCQFTKANSCFEGKRKHAVIWQLAFFWHCAVGQCEEQQGRNQAHGEGSIEWNQKLERRGEPTVTCWVSTCPIVGSTAHRGLVGIYVD
jgi:hypothetical protein